jgi:hypothetical protein
VAALQKNIECLGFVCSKELLDRLQTLTTEKLGTFYKNLVNDLREMAGAHREFKPVERRIVWADIALRKHRSWNNVKNNLSGVSVMARALTSLVKTDLHTLFSLHIRARGELVADQNGANSVFSVAAGITPFDLNRIASEFM